MSRAEVINNPTDPLILQTKLEEMQVYTHKALMQFPKREKFLLCAEIKDSLAEAMHLVIRMKKRYYKKTTLQDIDVEIDYICEALQRSKNDGINPKIPCFTKGE